MKNRKSLKILGLLVVSLFAVALVIGCGGGDQRGDGEYRESGTLRAGHVFDPSHPFQDGIEAFRDKIYERTDGRFRIDIHPGGVLGGEVAMVELTQAGDLDLVIATTAPIGNFTQVFMELDLPFMFENHEHVFRVLDGEIGQTMFEELERTARLKGLAYFENGFRHMTSSVRPINTPADLNGIIFRTMENPIHLKTFETFGATPIPMAFTELFIGLQQGVAEAQENPLPAIYTARLYEVQDHLAITNHFYGPAPLMMNLSLWNSLSPADQAIFQQAAIEARDIQRQAVVDMEGWIIDELEGQIQITRPNPGPWRDAVIPVYEYFINLGWVDADLIERIRQEAN